MLFVERKEHKKIASIPCCCNYIAILMLAYCIVYTATLYKKNRLCNITNFKEKQAEICCMTLTRWLEKGFSDLIRRVVILCNLFVICRRFGIEGRING